MSKVSVIIPFHNVEAYIRQCLDSVINQTLKDIEIICINDASDDESREIVENYARNDCRIKIIDVKTRQGQGFARNRALETAQGEYIGFVDSDDWIEPDMFEKLYDKAKENDDDIVICQAREYDDLNKNYITSDYYSLSILENMEDKVFSASDIKKELLDINVVLWNKIYKKSFLDKTGAKFPEGFIYEDLPFFFETILPAERIQIVWKNLYIYRINRKNSTMKQNNNKVLDRLDMVYLTYNELIKYDFLSDEINRIKGWIINDLFHRYILLRENFHKEFFFRMKKIFQSLEINDTENPYWSTIYHFQGYLMVLENDFESFNQKIFTKYLDIHDIENRLRIEMRDTSLVDKRVQAESDILGAKINEFYKNLNEINQNNEKTARETEERTNKKINDIVSYTDNKIKTEEENRKKSEIELTQKIEEIITNQKEKYEEEIKILKERISYLEKSPFEKIKDSIKGRK